MNVTPEQIETEDIQTEYLVFSLARKSDSGKTLVIRVYNKNEFVLGMVQWRASWRKYVFTPSSGSELDFDAACLSDIAAFVATLTMNHKKARA